MLPNLEALLFVIKQHDRESTWLDTAQTICETMRAVAATGVPPIVPSPASPAGILRESVSVREPGGPTPRSVRGRGAHRYPHANRPPLATGSPASPASVQRGGVRFESPTTERRMPVGDLAGRVLHSRRGSEENAASDSTHVDVAAGEASGLLGHVGAARPQESNDEEDLFVSSNE